MGKSNLFTKEQWFVFDQVSKNDFLRTHFYFTGGTALSYFYLQHRYSEDMDFFSINKFIPEEILAIVSEWSKKSSFTFESQWNDVVYVFTIHFPSGEILKVDFGYYPYKQIEIGIKEQNLEIDSELDIAINKVVAITQRATAKDFVDLYYLLQKKYSLWDLIEGIKIKFHMDMEPFMFAAYLADAESFTVLPRMIKSLTLGELKGFFRKKAKELATFSCDR